MTAARKTTSIVALAIMTMLEACGSPRITPLSQQRVVFIGDSITYGWSTQPEFTANPNWIGQGISGQASNQILARFQSDVIDLDPQAVHILAGTNDLYPNWQLCGPGTTDTCSNIEQMVVLARQNHIRVILGTVPPWCQGYAADNADSSDGDTCAIRNARVDELNSWLKEYAAAAGIELIDYHSVLADFTGEEYSSGLTGDGVHPNPEAYVLMQNALTATPD